MKNNEGGMFRSSKILNAARGLPCTCCGLSNDTTVAAHGNWLVFGKGKGLKSHDWAVAYLCMHCHDLVDGRAGKLSKQAQQDHWAIGWCATVRLWWHWSQDASHPACKAATEALDALNWEIFEIWTGFSREKICGVSLAI